MQEGKPRLEDLESFLKEELEIKRLDLTFELSFNKKTRYW